MKNKKAETGILETIIFIILNLVFCAAILIFVHNASSQSFIYEQAYAKQIALIIDNARADSIIMIDISELKKISDKNQKPVEDVFSVDKNNNKVKVNLNKKGGYSYNYFSNYNVEFKVNGKYLSVIITNKNE